MPTDTQRSVKLRIVADAGTAKATLDDIASKADSIDGKRSSISVGVNSGTTKAQLDEIVAEADALGIKNIRFNVKADTASADRSMDETAAKADSLHRSLLGAALGITGFGDAATVASGDSSMFAKALGGLSLATGVLEPAMAGVVVAAGGLASGLAAAGVGAGIFGLVAKSAISEVTAEGAVLDATQKQLLKSVNDYKNGWQGFVNTAIPGIDKLMGSGLKLMPGVFRDMGQFLPPVETALGHIVDMLGKGLGSSFQQGFFKDLAVNSGPALEKLAVAIGHVIVGVEGILKAFMPVSQEMLSGLDKITAKFATWGQTLGSHSGFQSLMSMFKTETPLAVKTLQNLGVVILNVVKAMTGLDGVGNSKTLLQVLTPLSGVLASLTKNQDLDRLALYLLAAADAGKKLNNVFQGLSSGVTAVKNVSSAVSDFSKGFSDADQAASDATGMWGTFGGKISSFGSLIQQAALKMGLLRTATVEGTEAQEGLDVAMEANPIGLVIVGVAALAVGIYELSKHSKAFRDFWKDAWKDIKDAFDDAFNWIKSHWATILVALTGPVGLAVVAIVKRWTAIKNGFTDLFNHIKQAWPTIVQVLESPINLVVGFFEKLPGRIMGALGNLPGLFKTLGVNAIIGLWNGILSLGDWLWGQIQNFVSTYITGPFKAILHIFSPSRVFHGFGENIVQGLAEGITGRSGVAVAATTGLARAVSAAFNPQLSVSAGAAAAAAGRGGTVNVTNHIQVSGVVGDAGSTGREIGKALNEYLRQTGQVQLVGF